MLFDFIIRKLRFIGRNVKTHGIKGGGSAENDNESADELSSKLKDNLKDIQVRMENSTDFKMNSFILGDGETSAALLFIDGLVDNLLVTNSVLCPLKQWQPKEEQSGGKLIDALDKQVICVAGAEKAKTLQEVLTGYLSGNVVLLVDGCAQALILDTKGWEKRNITEPQSEMVVRGPREGFTEDLRTNTSLMRRKIRNEKLKSENMNIGRKTQTGVCLMYLEGVVNANALKEIKWRLKNLDAESILETGYIEEYIEDAPFSPFATMAYTEKPDVAAAKILEGRIAILVDGTPFALTAPMLFIESFQTAEDYYERPLYASLLRIIRYAGYILTILAPAIYVALMSFHHELIPTTLLFTVAKAREGTPFPVFFEALIMIFAFELLREAGVRLPRPVGQAISIVGALIMGEAAVSAGLIGAPMVIVIAVTSVAGFLVPTQNESSSILRVVAMIPAAVVGFYGVGLMCIGTLIHLATLESFGVPFFDSFGQSGDSEDALIRKPLWSMAHRPQEIAEGDTTRIKPYIPPMRPHSKNDEGGQP